MKIHAIQHIVLELDDTATDSDAISRLAFEHPTAIVQGIERSDYLSVVGTCHCCGEHITSDQAHVFDETGVIHNLCQIPCPQI